MITANVENHLLLNLKTQEHEIKSDVKKEVGGEGSAMNAHELLEASLAACSLQTMLLYGGRKNWSVAGTVVNVNFVGVGSEVEIERSISFNPALKEEERLRLLEIANKCPIHKILAPAIRIHTYEK